MEFITIKETLDILEAIRGIYGEGAFSSSVSFTEDNLGVLVWYEVLKGFSFEAVFAALVRYVKNNKSVPFPCDLWRLALETSEELGEQGRRSRELRDMTAEEFKERFCIKEGSVTA